MNFKPVVFTCVITFVLSFLVALISGAGFGISLLRGLILALCFGALSVGISFLFYKFLNDGSYDASVSESQRDQNLPPIGNKVDITINDEELQEDDFSPKFVLTGQNQMLNDEDVQNDKTRTQVEVPASKESNDSKGSGDSIDVEPIIVEDEPVGKVNTSASPVKENSPKPDTPENPAPSFKPVSLTKPAEGSDDLAGQFPDIENTLGDKSILGPSSITENDVDVLPDMGGTAAGLKDDTVTDSEFASAGKSAPRLSDAVFPDGSMADSKDSTLMAEAIRTILRKEE
ncbi:MAG: Rab5-interacting family protein [Treponema sp.]|nr:Rab5-interacting family protein [Treponema sp.]